MKTIISALAFAAVATSAFAIEPVPGSITYDGQPHVKLERVPVGSTFRHQFHDNGRVYEEIYMVDADRNLELISRKMGSEQR
ncbi:hypothetical protein [Chelativorans sp. M5D2P16]|uniref:hypothetical protein n=1 Tax=Chelativorans sp. M5D2P16 TaxID=3095678 RepID=UPI002ACA9C39|nr:hypothetical protein [Chelativorans sp. M5D2P16]MDZ5699786.1 hypothetical protein [Chelativorans sp. M5D2P16]